MIKNDKYPNVVYEYEKGASISEIAKKYGVTRQAMHLILKRRGAQFRGNLRFGANNHFYRGGKRADDYVHNLLEQAIEDGKIKRQYICENCGVENLQFSDGRTAIEAHHHNYNKPYDVTWLCVHCHYKWHRKHRAIPRKIIGELS